MIPREIGATNVQQLQREIRIITCKINDLIKSPQAAFGCGENIVQTATGALLLRQEPEAKQNVAWLYVNGP